MKSENSILKLLAAFLLLGSLSLLSSGCATGGKVTNTEICMEIPFVDGAEGACAWSVSQEKYIVPAAEWRARRPFMLMIPVESWTEIKKDWLKMCRWAGPSCNVALDSVDKIIMSFDNLAREMAK